MRSAGAGWLRPSQHELSQKGRLGDSERGGSGAGSWSWPRRTCASFAPKTRRQSSTPAPGCRCGCSWRLPVAARVTTACWPTAPATRAPASFGPDSVALRRRSHVSPPFAEDDELALRVGPLARVAGDDEVGMLLWMLVGDVAVLRDAPIAPEVGKLFTVALEAAS